MSVSCQRPLGRLRSVVAADRHNRPQRTLPAADIYGATSGPGARQFSPRLAWRLSVWDSSRGPMGQEILRHKQIVGVVDVGKHRRTTHVGHIAAEAFATAAPGAAISCGSGRLNGLTMAVKRDRFRSRLRGPAPSD